MKAKFKVGKTVRIVSGLFGNNKGKIVEVRAASTKVSYVVDVEEMSREIIPEANLVAEG